jgi:hypothetical protein
MYAELYYMYAPMKYKQTRILYAILSWGKQLKKLGKALTIEQGPRHLGLVVPPHVTFS